MCRPLGLVCANHDPTERPMHPGAPLFGPLFGPGGVRGGLRPAPQAELREDVADVVLDGLATDEEAVGDLGVRETEAEELEHFRFALRQQPIASSYRRRAA